MSDPPIEQHSVELHNVAHAAVFGISTLLLLYDARFPSGIRGWLCVFASTLYGAIDEFHQASSLAAASSTLTRLRIFWFRHGVPRNVDSCALDRNEGRLLQGAPVYSESGD